MEASISNARGLATGREPVRAVSLTAAARFAEHVLAALLYSRSEERRVGKEGAWLAPGLLLFSARQMRPRAALLGGVAFSMLIGYGITGWAIDATLVYYDANRLLSTGFAALVWLLYGGIPYGLMLAAYTAAARRFSYAARPALGATLWAGSELLRASLLTGMPWALLGHTQHANLTIVQIADLGGVYAVSFVLVFVSVALVELIAERLEQGTVPLRRRLAIPALILGATVVYGWWRYEPHVPEGAPGARRIAVVQGNIANQFRWQRSYFERSLAIYAGLTADSRADRPELVVWPENAVNFYVDREPLLRARLGALARSIPEGLIFGGPRLDEEDRAFISAYFLDPSGAIAATYDKRHLVPFAEYDPLPWYGGTSRADALVNGGKRAAPLPIAPFGVGLVICYEVLFPDLVRAGVAQGAQLLVNMSNDSWLDHGDGAAPQQHFSMAIFRAIETRRYLVRAASSGVSGFVSPSGEAYARIESGERGALTASVAPMTEITPYVRFGDAWIFLANGLALALFARRRQSAA